MLLKKLSDQDLLLSTKNLVVKERELGIEILNHLKEIDLRKLYLDIGYPSLWGYVTQELGYSEGSAQRRIEAMRALKQLPVLEAKIESGLLSLSNVARAQSLIRKAEKSALPLSAEQKILLFSALEHKSQKQAEVILGSHFPEQVLVQDKVRPLNEELSEIRLTAKKELLTKLDQVKSLLSHKNPNPSLAELIEMMADFLIAKKDPMKAHGKGENRFVKLGNETERCSEKASQVEDQVQTFSAINPKVIQGKKNSPPLRRSKNPRYIPAPVRRAVFQKAQGVCEYKDPQSGRRCQSQHRLEVDHEHPLALGGTSSPENLRILCKNHNLWAARQATLI
jgi:5-methylcytosine-specific restriction endonuclease McrA